MADSGRLPAFVIHRDGGQEAFDGDAIFRSLYEAADRLGAADPFRTRELTDAALHFLAESDTGPTIDTDAVRDTVGKVVRELGHPALAAVYDRPSASGPNATDRAFADPYPPEIRAAERCRLLTLDGAHTSDELIGTVVAPRPVGGAERGMLEALQDARRHTRGYVALDSPEWLFTTAARSHSIRDWVRDLRSGLQTTGLRAVLNLNCSMPPAWAVDPTGPLFPAIGSEDGSAVTGALFDELLAGDTSALRIDWHLSARDFEPPAAIDSIDLPGK